MTDSGSTSMDFSVAGASTDAPETTRAEASLARRIFRRIAESFRHRALLTKVTAIAGWILFLYALVMSGLGWLYSYEIGKALEDLIAASSLPLNAYLDLPGWLRLPAGLLAGIASLTGGWTLLAPLLPERTRPELPPAAEEPIVEALDIGTFQRIDEGQQKDQIPEYVLRLITRFVDIQTLQPVGVLRSVLILMESDIEAYRHLLMTPLCARSLQRLRQMPPNFFDDTHCRQVLESEEFGSIYRKLGIPLDSLVPHLVARIEGERQKTPPPPTSEPFGI